MMPENYKLVSSSPLDTAMKVGDFVANESGINWGHFRTRRGILLEV